MNSFFSFYKNKKSFWGKIKEKYFFLFKDFFSKFPALLFKKKNKKRIKYNLDKKFIYSLAKSKIPNLRQLKYIPQFLSKKEKRIIKISLNVILICSFILFVDFYKSNLQVVAIEGGEYVEALVGFPKNINPLYSSIKDIDSDISYLVFSSLFKRGKNGDLVKDLVTDFEISPDNRVYDFKIRDDVKWHNNAKLTREKLTIEDIIFTFNIMKDPAYKSTLQTSFKGVEIKKIDDFRFKFILKEPYAPFLELLTFGILPQELWLQIDPESANLAELNLKPIGSGPYQFQSLKKDKSGEIKKYDLVFFEEYYGEKSYIKKLSFKFYASLEEAIAALNENLVHGLSYLPINNKDDLIAYESLNFYKLNLPQVNTVLFNPKNKSVLNEKKIRKALAYSIDRNAIKKDLFDDNIRIVDGPILPDSFYYNANIEKYNFDTKKAKKLLDESGYKEEIITEEMIKLAQTTSEQSSSTEEISKSKEIISLGPGIRRKKGDEYLTIVLTTVETKENLKVVEYIRNYWEQIGVKTFLNILPVSKLQYDVIRSSNFEALFFGQIIGNDPDLYVFWHSSQIEDGLNILGYNNQEVDKLLEAGRILVDADKRLEKYNKFQEIITEDVPAIFMYSSIYNYVQSKKIKDFDVQNISLPRDRFANIHNWYIKTTKKLIW